MPGTLGDLLAPCCWGNGRGIPQDPDPWAVAAVSTARGL